MLEDFYIAHIRRELSFTPNAGQEEAIRGLASFLLSREQAPCFVLRGYAGTGKTSLVAALTRAMQRLNQRYVLLAPTGRAAKVLSAYSGSPAYTIHKHIYRQRQAGLDEPFSLAPNLKPNTLFIVDEASMVANAGGGEFGSGCLLDDLIRYVYSGRDCRLLLVGDDAQLPPVGQSTSPALQADYLRGYGLTVSGHSLTEVSRQALDSSILRLATHLREQLSEGNTSELPLQELISDPDQGDVRRIEGNEVQQLVEEAYREVGQEETLLLTRTNRRTNLYNQGVRASILWQEGLLTTGDRILITRNNYFWLNEDEDENNTNAQNPNARSAAFIANGDMFTITRLRDERELYGHHFIDAQLHSLDYDYDIEATLWLDTLTTDSPEGNNTMQRDLFWRIAEDYPELRNRKRDLVKAVLASPYYNALHLRYAYCVTGHKAQGGQWKRVFIDPAISTEGMLRPDGSEAANGTGQDFYRWLYTALTRSREQVYLIQFPPTPKSND